MDRMIKREAKDANRREEALNPSSKFDGLDELRMHPYNSLKYSENFSSTC